MRHAGAETGNPGEDLNFKANLAVQGNRHAAGFPVILHRAVKKVPAQAGC